MAGPPLPVGGMGGCWAQLTGKRPPGARIRARAARRLAPLAGRAQSALSLPQAFSGELMRTMGASYAARSDKARVELGWRPRPIQAGMLETFEWIAASEPADNDQGERRIAWGLVLVAVGLLLLWPLGRPRSCGSAGEPGSGGAGG